MLLRLLYNEQLAQASYLVGCQACGEALVVDPNRDIDQYLALAAREGFSITAVTETHIHADFVSGSRELAARAGATLNLSDEGTADWKYQFADDANVKLVKDGDEIAIGNVRLKVMHSPGHTPEHISFVLTDTAGADEPMGIFTGDFVFVGDVGRPDLLETAAGMAGTMAAGARDLYHSLQRFQDLPDYLQIWPGHGAGSACGKALGAVPQSTVGYEKLFNWAFRAKTEADFVAMVLEGQPEPPFYFKEMKRVNKEGPAFVGDLAPPPLLPNRDIDAALANGQTVVDMRPARAFAGGHVPGTINIPVTNSYLTWAGWLLSYDEPFAIIVDEEHVEETVAELRLIGLDNVRGYWTPDVLDEWDTAEPGRNLQTVDLVTLDEVEDLAAGGEVTVLDVRGSGEYAEAHIPGALNVPIGFIPLRLDEIPEDKPLVVHCQSGVRSSIAASVLQRHGRTNLKNFVGSFGEWSSAGKPVETGAKERESAVAD